MRSALRLSTAALAVVAALAMGACDSGSKGSDASAPTSAPATSAAASPSDSPTDLASAAASAEASVGALTKPFAGNAKTICQQAATETDVQDDKIAAAVKKGTPAVRKLFTDEFVKPTASLAGKATDPELASLLRNVSQEMASNLQALSSEHTAAAVEAKLQSGKLGSDFARLVGGCSSFIG